MAFGIKWKKNTKIYCCSKKTDNFMKGFVKYRLKGLKFLNRKGEDMELIKEIEKYLPIPVYPSRELCKLLRQKGIDIDKNTELKITSVFDSGETGGIVCSIMERKGEVFVVSLTHLNIKPDHPLSDKILKYQKDRIKNLSKSK